MNNEISRGLEAKKITLIGFWINALLVIVKISCGILGRSGAMIADGVHSLSDFFSDIVVLVGFKLAQQPEDDSHNYGHGKYETLATIIISLLLIFIGCEIFKTGFNNILAVINGSQIPKPKLIALFAAVLSIITKEILYHYTKKVGKKINSNVIIANAWHHRSDALSSVGTLFGIGGAIILGHQWTILDPIASVIVSIFIFKVAFSIFKPALDELMERSLSDNEVELIEKILLSDTDVLSYHKLRTRKVGTKPVIEMHIFVDPTLSIAKAHDISTAIEIKIRDSISNQCIITIHIEPEPTN